MGKQAGGNLEMGEGWRTGFVKWFDAQRGFGFIRSLGVEEDIFVHFEELRAGGHRVLVEGQEVRFILVKRTRGLCAVSVIPGDQGEKKICPRCRYVWCQEGKEGA